ncbi:MAG: hypothetical protein FJ344_05640 [Sphingomonadales bacterium]|nr:hypothetical protein [Sphingomonadales bacterium]
MKYPTLFSLLLLFNTVMAQTSIPSGLRLKREVLTGSTYAEFKQMNGILPPVYRITHNLNGAQTIGTNRVWTGGSSGLQLNGQGMTLGIWDSKAVRTGHQAFGGRASILDGTTTNSDHATHVGGTMVGSGTGQSTARGMASSASLRSFDWTDDVAEMASEGAGGLLVSNHSYGLVTGWAWGDYGDFGSDAWYWYGAPGDTIDYNFGRYSEESADWDQVAFNAPNYLIVKSAGNSRGYGPAPGTTHYEWTGSWTSSTTTRQRGGGSTGYDCLSHASVSKNVLSVGAVEGLAGGYTSAALVVGSSFHSWGPTDDGRIKPDVVTKGVGVYSSTAASNTSYDTYNGTSMASPMASGSAILLQQHYKALNSNQVMRSATLRGLIVHTADEVGPGAGPDYTFGWGLMNTARAAGVISEAASSHRILQQSLSNGATYTFSFYNDSTLPLKATLCWTDPAGTPNTAVLNQTSPRLVRDLDVRIVRSSDNSTFLPWVLNLQSPQSPATRADNIRDNVEQVLLDGLPQAGMYTVRVTHKGSITAPQAFSLIVSGVSGLTAPNATVSGSVRYVNTSQSPVRGVRVRAMQGSVRVDSTLTNTQGQFSFTLPPGTYTIDAITTTGMPVPASINASDALQASRHGSLVALLTGLPLVASDVNNSGQTNGTDALQIQRYASLLQSSFARGPWVFSAPQSVTLVAGQTTTVNLQSIATGDVNASFTPQ